MIRYLSLLNCVVHPTVNVGLRCLTELDLYGVRITGDELGRLLSNSFALEKLRLVFCSDIIRLKIPFLLQRLSYLDVSNCSSLQVIENKAPNISIFEFAGGEVQLSLGESLQLKNLSLDRRRGINYAIDKLPSSVPNLDTLTLRSRRYVCSPISGDKYVLVYHSISISWNIILVYADFQCTHGAKKIPPPQGLEHFYWKLDLHAEL